MFFKAVPSRPNSGAELLLPIRPIVDLFKEISGKDVKIVLTTDHGTINCKAPSKVIGDKNISSNLRYKTGRSLSYEEKDVYAVRNPKDIFLPTVAMNAPFVFAKEDYNEYLNN